jgi:hypothetical protein
MMTSQSQTAKGPGRSPETPHPPQRDDVSRESSHSPSLNKRDVSPDEQHRVVAVLGRELWVRALVSPDGELAEQMRHPQPGDLVLEISRIGRTWDPDSIGTLLRVEGEFPEDRYVVASCMILSGSRAG